MKRYIRSATTPNIGLAKSSKDPEELARLADDRNGNVRYWVAENPNTPADALAQLANDEEHLVRCAITENPNASADVLIQLASDESEFVRSRVAGNPNTPLDVLAQLADDSEFVRAKVAQNPNTSPDVLAQLASDEDANVRYWVAGNSNTPSEILEQLTNDGDKDVKELAISNPNCLVRSKRSKKSNNWPSTDEWYAIDSDEEFENKWGYYLAGPEDKVNKQLQIFTEPSVQGGMGGMFIFDESKTGNESFSIDFQDWCDQELNMAAESKNAKEYQQKYKAFVEGLIAENWG